MHIDSLGYAGVNATDLAAWGSFARAVLGVQVMEEGESLALRLDERAYRVRVHGAQENALAYLGWDVGDSGQLAAAVSELTARGLRLLPASAEELQSRRVQQMAWLLDPIGNRLELFHGLARARDALDPPRPCAGFRTGELGFGHAVLAVPRIDDVLSFYRDVLGMRLSDYANDPFRAVFFHVNARHHSLALIEAEHSGLHHLMIEALSIDDLGRAYDAALERNVVRVTLGRHTNDHMMSFYAASPSGFMVEYGWGGRSVDDATWQVEEMVHGPSIWGHERTWLSEGKRAQARELRLRAAAAGLRAPVHVSPEELE
jgi:2,3-dihydroxybiphenyl 1,2-dioxygenase